MWEKKQWLDYHVKRVKRLKDMMENTRSKDGKLYADVVMPIMLAMIE